MFSLMNLPQWTRINWNSPQCQWPNFRWLESPPTSCSILVKASGSLAATHSPAGLAIVVTTGIKPRSQSPVHLFQPCAGGSTDLGIKPAPPHIRLILLWLDWVGRVGLGGWGDPNLRQNQKCIWKLYKGQWLGLCWCDCGLWGWSSAGSPQGDLGWLQTTNNHPHPLVLARGFHLFFQNISPKVENEGEGKTPQT